MIGITKHVSYSILLTGHADSNLPNLKLRREGDKIIVDGGVIDIRHWKNVKAFVDETEKKP